MPPFDWCQMKSLYGTLMIVLPNLKETWPFELPKEQGTSHRFEPVTGRLASGKTATILSKMALRRALMV